MELAQNNDRAWFQPRKSEFEALLKDPMEAMVAALAEAFDARGLPLQADPKRSIFRIYRDTRFAKDKSPYKTHMGASFPWVAGGSAAEMSHTEHANGAYFHLQPGENFAGGGMWHASKPVLDAFRQRILDDEPGVRRALEDRAFVAEFGPVDSHESLKRVPPGYRRITRWPTCSATRTWCSAGAYPTMRSTRPTCRRSSPTRTRRPPPCSRSSIPLDD